MANISESWDPAAHTLGYEDEKAMLKDLYCNQACSISEIARILGYAPNSVRRRLLLLDIVLHDRGGPNNTAGSKLRDVSDDDLVNTHPKALIKAHGVHLSTIFKELRRRKLCTSARLRKIQSGLLPKPPAGITLPLPSGVETTLDIVSTINSSDNKEE